MFILTLNDDPVYYITVVVTLIFSIVLHELGHGWAALWQGDDTPRVLGHLTPDPLTHIGPLGFVAIFVMGLGWGLMPVDPSRFRSRYGDLYVSAAGPAMNLLLAIIALTIYATWGVDKALDGTDFEQNLVQALFVFGLFNVVLVILNLIPIPPLDGSRMLANISRQYDDWRHETAEHHMFFLLALFGILSALEHTRYGLFTTAGRIAHWYIGLFI